jgi:small subunit ribosomal protein S20
VVAASRLETAQKHAMANIKSQKKRNLQNETRRVRNKGVRSELKTRVKVARDGVEQGAEDADELVRTAQRRLGKAASKGVIHKNAAARRQSRLMKSRASAES